MAIYLSLASAWRHEFMPGGNEVIFGIVNYPGYALVIIPKVIKLTKLLE